MKKIPKNKQASEEAERRQGASLLLADAVLLALGGGKTRSITKPVSVYQLALDCLLQNRLLEGFWECRLKVVEIVISA